MRDLKAIYKAPNEESGYQNWELFAEKWESEYPICVRSWRENWDELSPFFNYSEEVRKIIYTTNIIENLNRQYRKVTKNKPVFPTDMSLMKALYLATKNSTQKWTYRVKNWGKVKNELIIMHESAVD